ncbi:hypothetical protein PG987_005351 [Apiospora arundinis]
MSYSLSSKSEKKKSKTSDRSSRLDDYIKEDPRDAPWSPINTRDSSGNKEHKSSGGGGGSKKNYDAGPAFVKLPASLSGGHEFSLRCLAHMMGDNGKREWFT